MADEDVRRIDINTPAALGAVMPLLHWAMPSKYHSIHKNDLARAMAAQSEQAFLATEQSNTPKKAIVKILEYKEMEPFFVKGGDELEQQQAAFVGLEAPVVFGYWRTVVILVPECRLSRSRSLVMHS